MAKTRVNMKLSDFEKRFGKQLVFSTNDYPLVYFLIDSEDHIVYVGKSSSMKLQSRLFAHRKNKSFVDFFIIRDLKNNREAFILESAFIHLLSPKYNKNNSFSRNETMKYFEEWEKRIVIDLNQDEEDEGSELEAFSKESKKAKNRIIYKVIDFVSAVLANIVLLFFMLLIAADCHEKGDKTGIIVFMGLTLAGMVISNKVQKILIKNRIISKPHLQ